ncbi:fibroblast growth factor receptor-like 1 [Octopus vulgaris]|uniref:Fibroblast growth factor receptor-like 1 n=1 Tax=Octopus vulgaris TaxID=6645 RepID=A0AA36BN84_OCTVU|nr:fibroblast growth factor receptor-like 1 [Octopus vulgaris]
MFSHIRHNGPPFINQTAVFFAYIGKNFRFRCPITSTPPPYMQWSKDGHTINIAWERFCIQEMGLRIKDVEIEDSGLYTCKATNSFGSVQFNFTLTVIPEKKEGTQQNNLYPHQLDPTGATEPRFLHLRKMKKKAIPRPAGSSIWFRCRASGNPRPEIQWLKDGQMWTSDNMGNYQDSRPCWTLKIDDLRQEDSGQYTCVVTNIHGTINYTYSLEVVDPKHSRPNQKITPSTSKILFVEIWIPAIMLAIITGAIALVYSNRCHGRCSQTSHNSNHEHVELEHVPTSHHEDPVNYPQMSAYHTPNIHAGFSSMSSSSSFSIASSSIPPRRH